MTERIEKLLEHYLRISPEQSRRAFRRAGIALAAMFFVLAATMVVAFDDVFTGRSNISSLSVGDIAPTSITAPEAISYTSQILTDQRRQAARDAVAPVYDPPDPNVARQRTDLARQILDYIDNVRHDAFATPAQQAQDISAITALKLQPNVIQSILDVDDDTWRAIDDEIINVLPRVMRESIRESQLQTFRDQLPTQVSIRFNPEERGIIVAIVGDLLRANTFENPDATQTARDAAAAAVPDVVRTFARGEIVIGGGEKIDPVDYEALQALGLLTSADRRLQETARSLLATVIVVVVTGLYIIRFKPELVFNDARMLSLLAVIFLINLLAARLVGINGQIYLYPTAALALVFVGITGPEIAIIGALGLALLVGMMADNSLEIATMAAAGGLIGALTLRRLERFSSYFFAGLMVSLVNAAVVAIFNVGTSPLNADVDAVGAVVYSMLNGLLVAVVAIGAMYIVTYLFNLPTSMKLAELSQPSQPLLQRLLREAPGTYQHSLQVANLSEQAATAVGANAELSHVAALYHDIGKMLNPAFFAENQQDIGNPHDTLNDPYRSADIIINHVTEGDEMARQYRLPNRIRDFIREHHGTTQVFVFYKHAVSRAGGDESAVDITDFTYPGPKPQTRETAIMMLADSCESATRSVKPTSRQQIAELVHNIIEDKRTAGQLDEASLTLNDLKTIETIFIEMLQAIFHPRINYQEAIARKAAESSKTRIATPSKTTPPVSTTDTKPRPPKVATQPVEAVTAPSRDKKTSSDTIPPVKTGENETVEKSKSGSREMEVTAIALDNDEEPLPDVPPLPRSGENRATQENGRRKDDSPKTDTPATENGETEQKPSDGSNLV